MDNIFKPDELNHQLITLDDALQMSGSSPFEIHRLLMTEILHAFKFYPKQKTFFAPAEYRRLWPYEVEGMLPEDLRDLLFAKDEIESLLHKPEEEYEETIGEADNQLQISFYKHGPHWLIGKRGQELAFPDLRGFSLIHYLLRRSEESIYSEELFHLGEQPIEEIEIRITDKQVSRRIAEDCRKKVRALLKTAVQSLRSEFDKSNRTRMLMNYFSLRGDGKTKKPGHRCWYRPPDGQSKPKFILYAK